MAARSARKEGLSRRHRFAAPGSFGPVLRGPHKLRGRYAVLHVIAGSPDASRLGIALARRMVPSSCERNRLKRLVRESFRRHALKSAGLDCVVTLRERLDSARTPEAAAEIRELFDRALAAGGPR